MDKIDWKSKEPELSQLLDSKMSIGKIARKLKVSYGGLYEYMQREGLSTNNCKIKSSKGEPYKLKRSRL